jgi:predicted acylesterase/phospholipase RssA
MDGGVVNNTPISHAVTLGADELIGRAYAHTRNWLTGSVRSATTAPTRT